MSDEAAHADFIDRTRPVFPHYWIVERSPDLTTFIVGFADTPTQYQSLLARRTAQLTRARVPTELLVIDRGREAVVVRRHV